MLKTVNLSIRWIVRVTLLLSLLAVLAGGQSITSANSSAIRTLAITESNGYTYAIGETGTPQPVLSPSISTPTADANGPYTGDEGSPITLDASASFDSDGAIASVEWDLDGDGQFDDAVATTTGVTFPDNGSFTVGVRVTNADGASDIATSTVTVLNVAPSVDAGPDLDILGGEFISQDISFSDPGVNDGRWILSVDWGDGTSDVGLANSQAAPTSIAHKYNAPGSYTVEVCVTDNDRDSGCDSRVVTVSSPFTPRSLKQGAIDDLLPYIPPDPIVITTLPGSMTGVDFAGQEYFTASGGMRGNASSSPVVIGDPIYVPQGNSDGEGGKWAFSDGGTVVDTGSIWVQTHSGNSWSIPLMGTSTPHTVRVYMGIYHWRGGGEYTVSVGDVSETFEKTERFGTLYQIDITFTGNTTFKVESRDSLSWSAFTLAAVVVSNGTSRMTSGNRDGGPASPPDISESEDGLGLAISLIQKSLIMEYWQDEQHLVPTWGVGVFERERSAVMELLELLDDPQGLTPEAQLAIQTAINDLVLADRTLAEIKVQETEAAPTQNPSKQSKIDELLGQARQNLADGNASMTTGGSTDAIEFYRRAWKYADEAMAIKNQPLDQ